MGLLEDEEQRRSQRLLRQQQAVSTVPKLLLLLTLPVIFCLLVLLFALEAGGLDILNWFDHHPAASSRYNPHHWVTRILAWAIILLFLHRAWRVVSICAKRLSLWWKVWHELVKKETSN
jgi:hypothetical protein